MRLFGIIGYPLGHSFSPEYFEAKFKREGITDTSYVCFPLEDISDLPMLIEREPSLEGLNVTIPYKEKVIPYLDSMDLMTEAVGAVNTIKIKDGRLIGFNTDVAGFACSIQPLISAHDKKALILGSGGSSKAVKAGLDILGLHFKVVSRSAEKGDLTYDELNDELVREFSMIIQTTPLGMFPETDVCPDIPYDALTSAHLCFDLVYNPEESMFLKKAKKQGARVSNGYKMLTGQAEASWKVWNV